MKPPATPRLISWNVTLRCPLRCSHCYVGAGEQEAEGVLSTEEAFSVIDQVRELGNPIIVLSGGEPLEREDIFEIARYGADRGVRMAMGTSGYTLDRKTASRIREAGITAVAISLDSAVPAVHDAFRGAAGAWERAVRAIRFCRDEGIAVRINTTVHDTGSRDADEVIRMGTAMGVRDYQVFFPVETGRARGTGLRGPEASERLIRDILAWHDEGVNVRPTCAPQFRRIAMEMRLADPGWGRGCIAGISYCRIYATGEVTPCPYLPVSAGNVRTTPLSRIWQESPVFTVLRDPGLLSGRCGACSYKEVCGGCRARAFLRSEDFSARWCDGLARPGEQTGLLTGEDPGCPYAPGGEAA
jgi:radical SAM protein with 4Fe4S-binding SPASM domain